MKKLLALTALACAVARGDALPASLYVQDGLIGHLDAIENGGAGVHEAAPSEWADLTGNQTFTLVNGSAFSADAWVGNSNRYITATSEKALAALKNKAFTLEMVISHPTESQANAFEYWTYFGRESSNRNLTMEIRHVNSKNPLVGGLQYRAKSYSNLVEIPADTGLTEWGRRQHLTVVCSGTTATLYCDGTNVLHKITNDALAPTLATLSFGASVGGASPLKSGAEICAVRMTERVLTPAEILRNDFLDRVRFMGASATDGVTGWRIENGAVQVLTHVGGLGVQFSTDGGTTWQDNALDIWSGIGENVSFAARLAADGSSDVILDALPAGATVSGGTVSFSAAMPARIVARTATSPATSLYVQDGLIGHLDAIENGGAGVHNASPSTWTDLTGNHTFTCANGAAFSSDAWVGNASRYVKTTSPRALGALMRKAFTLEMVIMHPETPIDPSGYEKWAVFGNDSKRQLMVEIRTMNSKNPVIQGLQYRADGYSHSCEVPNGKGTTTAWGRRHCVSVTCDGDSATLYLDGTNAIHTSSYGTVEPTMDIVAFGGYSTGASPLSAGAEICAVRLTERVLSAEERQLNRFLDGARFLGESVTYGARGYRIVDGKVQVTVSASGEGVEFSGDGGTTWLDGAITTWVLPGEKASLGYRVKNGTPAQRVLFAELPEGVEDIGGRLAFTMPRAPVTLAARVAHRPSTSYYVQDGLIGHLDAIENGGAGVHAAAPATWTDLTGNHTFTCVNGAAFTESAWVGDRAAARGISSSSAKALAALKNQKFTLEMVIAHPSSPRVSSGSYEYWAYFGNSGAKRQLLLDLRPNNSSNPLIQGLQYRANTYGGGCAIAKGTKTAWDMRQPIAVVCDENGATLYVDGTNAVHTSNYGTVAPTVENIRFGTSHDGSAAINTGAEICAVRMTERVLTADERVRNNFLDAARFKAELPDESCGYKLRESDGALLVHVSAPAVQIEPAGAEPVRAQYSLDGGEWTETLDGWVVADSEATVRVRATDRHYGPTWKEQTLTVSAPRTLSVELVELPPQNTIIVIR